YLANLFRSWMKRPIIINLSGGMRLLIVEALVASIMSNLPITVELETEDGASFAEFETSYVWLPQMEPLDIDVLKLLRTGKMPLKFIAENLGVSKPTVWRHVKKLEGMGIVVVNHIRDRRRSGAKIEVSLTPRAMLYHSLMEPNILGLNYFNISLGIYSGMTWWTGLGALLLLIYLTTPFLVAFLLIFYLSVRRGGRLGVLESGGRVSEVLWILLVGGLWAVINLASIGWLPSGLGGVETGTEPSQTLTVEAGMWFFKVGADRLAPYTPTEIVAWSTDTMHGVGIYDPEGRLITTIMLMPGMRERLVLTLQPGEYIIRCLEYCGDGHALMIGKFTVG
ncbi:MAG: CRISPR-associated CARF protein Csa3, partial [Nitrososphaerota archaeon]